MGNPDSFHLSFEGLRQDYEDQEYLLSCKDSFQDRTLLRLRPTNPTALDIPRIVLALQNAAHVPKFRVIENVAAILREDGCGQDAREVMELAVRMWLFINVTDLEHKDGNPEVKPIHWRWDESLQELVQRTFPQHGVHTIQPRSNVLLCYDLNLENIQKYAGLTPQWTSSLEDHLRIRIEGSQRLLRIFRHIGWLQRSVNTDETGQILPRQLLRETLMTYELLFRSPESRQHNFMEEIGNWVMHLEDFAPLEVRKFVYWRERLTDLHNEIHGPPRSLLQAIKDNRNPLVWWTFWLALTVALLTFIFGVATVILGVLQVQAAKRGG